MSDQTTPQPQLDQLPSNYQEVLNLLLSQIATGNKCLKIGEKYISINIVDSPVDAKNCAVTNERKYSDAGMNSIENVNPNGVVQKNASPVPSKTNKSVTSAGSGKSKVSSTTSNPNVRGDQKPPRSSANNSNDKKSVVRTSTQYSENSEKIKFGKNLQEAFARAEFDTEGDASSLYRSNTSAQGSPKQSHGERPETKVSSPKSENCEDGKRKSLANTNTIVQQSSVNMKEEDSLATEANNDQNKDISMIVQSEINEETASMQAGESMQLLKDDSEVDEAEHRDQFDFVQVFSKLASNPEVYSEVCRLQQFLQKKENKLKRKEQKLEEQQRALMENSRTRSFSSTQYSAETHSTGFNKTSKELQAMLNDILNEEESFSPKTNSQSASEANLHFAFLFSAPLVINYTDREAQQRKRPIYMEIDYRSELQSVKDILQSTGNEIKFRNFVATQTGLSECLDLKPRGIHFCGHGVENNQKNFGIFTNAGDGDYLIFEDEIGRADFLSCKGLKTLLTEKKLDHDIEFVFVASCHSHLVGEVFLQAGAKHVLCVAKNETISDLACQKFTKYFYHAYYNGQHTICEAFKCAQQQLKLEKDLRPGEANKFVLLTPEQDAFSFHTCSNKFQIFPSGTQGSGELFRDLTPVPKYNRVPSRVEHFLGRHLEVHEIIQLIRHQRFVTIKGVPGIGKSSLCKEVVNFLLERHAFKDGIIYLSIHACESIEAVVSNLDSNVGYLSKRVNSKRETKGNLITQVCDFLKEKCGDLLLVLDNADQVLHNDKGSFRDLVEVILATCPRIKILVTSRSTVGGALQGFTEKIYNLSHLDKANAKELFFLRAPRTIPEYEIKELLDYEPTDKEHEYIASLHFNRHEANSQGSNSGTGFWNALSRRPKPTKSDSSLENHLIMEILGGHPQSISLAAALLVDRSLKDLFKLLTSRPLLEVLTVQDLTEEEKKSFNSLQVSLDVSLEHLTKRNKEAVRFFGLVGLMPAGASDEDFTKIWGTGWQELAGILVRSSLLLKTERKLQGMLSWYSLYPFMTRYAEERLDETDLNLFCKKLAKHLVEKGTFYYGKLGTAAVDSENHFQSFIMEELNFKACIYREVMSCKKSTNDQRLQNNSYLSNAAFSDIGMNSLLMQSNEEGERLEVLSLTKKSLELLDKVNSSRQWQSNLKRKCQMLQQKLVEENDSPKHDTEDPSKILVTESVANMLSSYSVRGWEIGEGLQRNASDDNLNSGHEKLEATVLKRASSSSSGRPAGELSGLSRNLSVETSYQQQSVSDVRESNESRNDMSAVSMAKKTISNISQTSIIRDSLIRESVISECDGRDSQAYEVLPNPFYKKLQGELLSKVKEEEEKLQTQSHEGSSACTPRSKNEAVLEKERKMSAPGDLEAEKSAICHEGQDKKSRENNQAQETEGDRDTEPENAQKLETTANLSNKINKSVTPKSDRTPQSPTSVEADPRVFQNSFFDNAGGTDSSQVNDQSYTRTLPRNAIKEDVKPVVLKEDETNRSDEETTGKISEDVKLPEIIESNAAKEPENKMTVDAKRPTHAQSKTSTLGGSFISEDNAKVAKTAKSKFNALSKTKTAALPKEPAIVARTSLTRHNEAGATKNKMKPGCHLTLLYSSILFVLRRYGECERIVDHGFTLCVNLNDRLALANFRKLRACLLWIKKDFSSALNEFTSATDEFRGVGSSLGIAISDAAIGYIKAHFMDDNNGSMRKLESALSIYKDINHTFGMHFIHRWLSIVMNKMPHLKSQSRHHAEEARKVLQHQRKQECLGSKHKAGTFVVRWMGDVFSIFLEIATIADLKGGQLKKKKEEPEISNALTSSQHSSTNKLRRKSSLSNIHPRNAIRVAKGALIDISKEVVVESKEEHQITPVKNQKTVSRLPPSLAINVQASPMRRDSISNLVPGQKSVRNQETTKAQPKPEPKVDLMPSLKRKALAKTQGGKKATEVEEVKDIKDQKEPKKITKPWKKNEELKETEKVKHPAIMNTVVGAAGEDQVAQQVMQNQTRNSEIKEEFGEEKNTCESKRNNSTSPDRSQNLGTEQAKTKNQTRKPNTVVGGVNTSKKSDLNASIVSTTKTKQDKKAQVAPKNERWK